MPQELETIKIIANNPDKTGGLILILALCYLAYALFYIRMNTERKATLTALRIRLKSLHDKRIMQNKLKAAKEAKNAR